VETVEMRYPKFTRIIAEISRRLTKYCPKKARDKPDDSASARHSLPLDLLSFYLIACLNWFTITPIAQTRQLIACLSSLWPNLMLKPQ
jgi:hypothetical protein